MMQRVVALATLSRADHPRVTALCRALLERGDQVYLFCPGDGGDALDGVEHVTVGRALSSPPKLREVLGFGTALAARAGYLHLRRRFDTVVLHGGEEALALVAAVPRLTGARLVLDLDMAAHGAPAGVFAAVATLARKPALRLVNDVMASDELAVERVSVARPDVARVAVDAPACGVGRREKQPRLTVRTPVRVTARLEHLTVERRAALLQAVVAATETDERVTLVVEGVPAVEAETLAEAWGLQVEAAPARGTPAWAEAMTEVHVALTCDEADEALVPYLALGLPVMTVGDGSGLAAAGVIVHEPDATTESWAGTLNRLTRSSRERRDLIRKGWSWVEEHGWEAQSRRLYAVVDGQAA